MLTIEYAKDPFYADKSGNIINLTVKFYEFLTEVPFTADKLGTEEYMVELYNNAFAGDYGIITPYVQPVLPSKQQNKATAQKLLSDTDWTSIVDVSNSQVSNPYLINQTEFLLYRSQIRSIAVSPTEGPIEWPVEPLPQWSS